ncbi:hypothetical protein [Dendronalium phyllosphericum]|nr:hypothetical protein [Dendronalium phyllosphericum]
MRSVHSLDDPISALGLLLGDLTLQQRGDFYSDRHITNAKKIN